MCEMSNLEKFGTRFLCFVCAPGFTLLLIIVLILAVLRIKDWKSREGICPRCGWTFVVKEISSAPAGDHRKPPDAGASDSFLERSQP